MSEAHDGLFDRYIAHVRDGLDAIAASRASSSAYHEGTAQLVQQAMDLAQRRFDRIGEDYHALTGSPLGVPGPPDPADPADAERAEDLLAAAGTELRGLEQVMEATRVALPLWAQLDALAGIACDHPHYLAWRDPVRRELERGKPILLGDDVRAIEALTETLRSGVTRYGELRTKIDTESDEVSDTLRRSGALTRSSERAVDAAFRRVKTGQGRAFKNGVSGAVIAGVIGYVIAFLYGVTQADIKAADVAKPAGMVFAGFGFMIGLGVGWYRFVRPAKAQIVEAEAKQVRAEKAIEDERVRLDALKRAAKALPYDVAAAPSGSAPVAATASAAPVAPSSSPAESNADAIAAALDAELG